MIKKRVRTNLKNGSAEVARFENVMGGETVHIDRIRQPSPTDPTDIMAPLNRLNEISRIMDEKNRALMDAVISGNEAKRIAERMKKENLTFARNLIIIAAVAGAAALATFLF